MSCSSRKQISYIKDVPDSIESIINSKFYKSIIQVGDVLKIEVQSVLPEAAIPYNKISSESVSQNLQVLQLQGYLVKKDLSINFPVLGRIDVEGMTTDSLEKLISQKLNNEGHLVSPNVKIRKLNSKFTVLGEVRNPGTFSFLDEKLNVFQAIGYAGDLTIEAKRKDITIVRELNGVRIVKKINLNDSQLLDKPFYYIKNNDVILVEPNYSKVKSAGFIGSPQSIASISSLLLSITLLIINNN